MGLFTQRPQFDDELPGLPGEPLRPETVAERLPDAGPIDIGLGSLDEGTVVSVTIPVAPVLENVEPEAEVEEAAEAAGDD